MSIVYLAALLVSIAGMAALDVRYRLFFRAAPLRATIVLAAGVAFLLAWDAAGIVLGIFFRTDNPISTGILLAPELPLEEPVFLAFLAYLAMVLYTGSLRLLARRRADVPAPESSAAAPDPATEGSRP